MVLATYFATFAFGIDADLNMRTTKRYIAIGIAVAALILVMVTYQCVRNYSVRWDSAERLDSIKNRGNDFLLSGKPDSAMGCYTYITSQYDQKMNHRQKGVCARAYNNIGYIYFYDYQNFDQAFDYYLTANHIDEELHNDKSATLLNMGNVYDNYNLHDNAIKYYGLAVAEAQAHRNWEIYLVAMANLVVKKAERGLSIRGDLDSYRRQVVPDSVPLRQYVKYEIQGISQYCQKRYADAIRYLELAAHKVDTRATPERFACALLAIAATCHAELGQYDKAVKVCQEALALSQQAKADDSRSSIYETMAKIYYQKGDSIRAEKALLHAFQLTDSISNKQKFNKANALQTLYDMKRRDEQMQIDRERRRVLDIVYGVTGVAAFIIILLLLANYRKSQRQLQMQKELYKQAVKESRLGSRTQRPVTGEGKADGEQAQIYDKVVEFMETSDEIYSAHFTAERFAELLGYKTRQISGAISEMTGKNFSTILGEYRVREACRRINDPKYDQYTFAAIAEQLGFRSRTNFITVFKRVTGLTPSEFVRMKSEQAAAEA